MLSRRRGPFEPPSARVTRIHVPVQFSHFIIVHLADEELLRRNLRSEPASSFRTSGSDATAVYKAMAMSAFVDMGKTLLHEFGVQRAAGLPAPAGGSPMLLSELFEQFSEEVVDAAFGVAEVSSTAARASVNAALGSSSASNTIASQLRAW